MGRHRVVWASFFCKQMAKDTLIVLWKRSVR